ncbi:MAG: 2-dehydropantoate 2-reductase [Alicyclobacillaceae bacterium]|nr:2-dehydropantoate 2-reductase [Alicyclobacillaceae bacterium]
MHVVVVGAGAVGGYFGGRLAQHGVPVTFVVRPERYRRLQERGLRVRSVYGDFALAPTLAVSADDVERPDLVLLCVKNYHIEGCLPAIRSFAERGALVLPLLNGIEHLERLRSVVAGSQLLGGTCHIEATLDAHGDVVHTSRLHHIVFGPLAETDRSRLAEVEDTLRQGAFRVKLSEAILSDMWTKYACLAVLSGLTAAVRRPIGDVLADEAASVLLEQVTGEVAKIVHACYPGLPGNPAQTVTDWIHSLPPGMTSSMHRDLDKGLPLELDSLQGVLLRLAESHGIDTPGLRAVFAVLHPHAKGRG